MSDTVTMKISPEDIVRFLRKILPGQSPNECAELAGNVARLMCRGECLLLSQILFRMADEFKAGSP